MAVQLRLDRVMPFRPIQYLGSKNRVVDAICDAVGPARAGARALDLFSGSSVVSQKFAQAGYSVTAIDALYFAAILAQATLGVDSMPGEVPQVAALRIMRTPPPTSDIENAFEDHRRHERAALSGKDADALLDHVGSIPQVWSDRRGEVRGLLARHTSDGYHYGLASTHYAGTFFSVEQTLAIDRILHATMTAGLNSWSQSVLVSAVLSAASTCAFTPGKHFAQYHRVDRDKRTDFHRRRVLEDRQRDVPSLFLAAVDRIVTAASVTRGQHAALARTVESFTLTERGQFDVVYGDPPYTAQQYSRFYHVLEVLAHGEIPDLETSELGLPTRGLYPKGRYLSPFCSRRAAPAALRDLARFAAEHSSVFVLSYSVSRGRYTGNARILDLSAIIKTCEAMFSRIRLVDLRHKYRPLNSVRMDDARDREVLIICER